MPEINVSIGGRLFEVACQDGEEHFLRTAAAMLDAEAAVLMEQIGRMPEARMLLMAGLMLADKTAAVEDQIREMSGRVEELEAALAEAHANPVRVEVPVIPEIIFDTFAEIAARAEALAASIEERTSDPYAVAEAGFAAGDVDADADADADVDVGAVRTGGAVAAAELSQADDGQETASFAPEGDAAPAGTVLIEGAALAGTADPAALSIGDDAGAFAGEDVAEDAAYATSPAFSDAEVAVALGEAPAEPDGAEGDGFGASGDAFEAEHAFDADADQDSGAGQYPQADQYPGVEDDFGEPGFGPGPSDPSEDHAPTGGDPAAQGEAAQEEAAGDERRDEDVKQ
ncbi:cell division protein ZapA [Phaeovulum sp. W22_SRMD_FR3]|uniref:cell division protein ZapA n=1 Tax=Phaeovulum sp. W22_SRMD_FR3 TaxID=3240274 RepID=UPI003F96756D